jgi:hypothetical protein
MGVFPAVSPGVRGRTWGAYVDDRGGVWALRIDADLALQEQRGFAGGDASGLVPLPRSWRPRFVKGIDSSGREQRAIVATLYADLWTGVRTDFDIEGTDGVLYTATVFEYVGERSRLAPTS